MDTLKGNLELFGLESIAGLLTSARKTGALRISIDGLNGRLFFVEGALVYGTTRVADGSVNDLRGRGIEIHDRRRSNWSLSLPELLRHQIVDVLVRIIRRNGGQFLFDEGVTTTALPSGRNLSFSAAEMLHRAYERLEQWREIEDVIPNSSVRYQLAPELPPDLFEVMIDARTWTFLATVGGGAAVEDITERLRIFEFPAALKMAEFVRRGLLVPVDSDAVSSARDANERARLIEDARPDESPVAEAESVDAEPDAADLLVTLVPAEAEPAPEPTPEPHPDPVPHLVVAEEDLSPLVTHADADADAGGDRDADEGGDGDAVTGHDVSLAATVVGDDVDAAETASHALAEWGDADPAERYATLDTNATAQTTTELGIESAPRAEATDAALIGVPESGMPEPATVAEEPAAEDQDQPLIDEPLVDGPVVVDEPVVDEPVVVEADTPDEAEPPSPFDPTTEAVDPFPMYRNPPIPQAPSPPPWEPAPRWSTDDRV